MNPKVSIIIATHNRAHFISETLDSILTQTYANWECIIVDDYSIDSTKEVIDEYIKNDCRFTYYLKTEKYKKGLSGTRNYGLDIAVSRNAEFIQLFDDDDIMHPKKLKLQMQEFMGDPKINFTTCRFRKFKENSQIDFDLKASNFPEFILETKNIFKDFLYSKIIINSSGPIFKANLIGKSRFDENLRYAEEKDFYLRMFLSNKIIYKPVNFVLFWYRKHDLSITNNFYSDTDLVTSCERKMRRNVSKSIILNRKINFSNIKFIVKTYIK